MKQNQTNTLKTTKLHGIGIYVSVLVSMVLVLLSIMVLVNILPPFDVIKASKSKNEIKYEQLIQPKMLNDIPTPIAK